MNIINIDYKELQHNINEYILNNNEIYISPQACVFYNSPFILMSENTFNFLYKKNKKYIDNFEKDTPTICGCHIAIADYLPFGECQLQ